jgi:hypothetical protein
LRKARLAARVRVIAEERAECRLVLPKVFHQRNHSNVTI